jgi:hypothetical protein
MEELEYFTDMDDIKYAIDFIEYKIRALNSNDNDRFTIVDIDNFKNVLRCLNFCKELVIEDGLDNS